MHDTVQKVLDPFLAEADRAVGDAYSAVLYGSAARGDFVPGRSNVNLLLVLDDAAPARLKALAPAFTAWRRVMPEPPLLVSRAEWAAATDVFPIEITDMRSAYRVVRGADPLDGLRVAPADLRRALERELRGKLLRLRQGYVAFADDGPRLGAMLGESLPTMLVLLRSLLALLGRQVPRDALEVVTAAATAVGFQAEQMALVVRHRGDAKWSCGASECMDYLEAVERTVRFVDQLQPGDQ